MIYLFDGERVYEAYDPACSPDEFYDAPLLAAGLQKVARALGARALVEGWRLEELRGNDRALRGLYYLVDIREGGKVWTLHPESGVVLDDDSMPYIDDVFDSSNWPSPLSVELHRMVDSIYSTGEDTDWALREGRKVAAALRLAALEAIAADQRVDLESVLRVQDETLKARLEELSEPPRWAGR